MEHENLSFGALTRVFGDHGIVRIATLVLAALLAYTLCLVFIEYRNPLTKVPGPWLARYSRFWLLKAVFSGKLEKINIELHRRYGPIVRIAPNEYSIDDPEATMTIYRSRDQFQKAPWYKPFGVPGEEANIFGHTNIKHHADRRRQVNHFYTLSAITEMAFRLEDVSRLLFDKLANHTTVDEPVDICKWLRLYAFDAMGNITFGQTFGCLEQQSDVVGLMSATTNFARYGITMGIFSEWHPLAYRILQFLSPQANNGLIHMMELGKTAMNQMQGKDSNDKRPSELEYIKSDLVTSMTEKHRRHPDEFSRADIVYHMVPNVVAGADTSSSTLVAAIYYLCKHPMVLSRLREELDNWAANQTKRDRNSIISISEARKLQYLQAVLKETMRVLSVVGKGLTRLVPKGGLVIANQLFPEGTIVGVNPWVAHANREVFGEDADEFRPERWLEDEKSVIRMEQNFLTFGRGPRYCIGKNMALVEIETLIPELLLRFDMCSAYPEQEWVLRNDWFIIPSNFFVRMRPRTTRPAPY